MHRPSGLGAVRLRLGLLGALFVLSLAQPAQAQAAAPFADLTFTAIITDGEDAADFWDILEVALAEPGDDTLIVRITAAAMPAAAPAPTGSIDFFFTAPGGDFRLGLGTSGAAVAAEYTSCTVGSATEAYCILPYEAIEAAVGDAITATSAASYLGSVIDYAPSDVPSVPGLLLGGNGADYVITGCSKVGGCGSGTTPGDSDGDGLNDTCETQFFGNLTATDNATADPDGDGLTNGQECALGTDPTKADTDGDGVDDKDDPFPTDAARGGANVTSSSSSTSRSSSSTSRSSSSSSSSQDRCADSDAGDAVDCLQSDVGYLGMSAGGFLAVVVLCVIALATRWSL